MTILSKQKLVFQLNSHFCHPSLPLSVIQTQLDSTRALYKERLGKEGVFWKLNELLLIIKKIKIRLEKLHSSVQLNLSGYQGYFGSIYITDSLVQLNISRYHGYPDLTIYLNINWLKFVFLQVVFTLLLCSGPRMKLKFIVKQIICKYHGRSIGFYYELTPPSFVENNTRCGRNTEFNNKISKSEFS